MFAAHTLSPTPPDQLLQRIDAHGEWVVVLDIDGAFAQIAAVDPERVS